MTLGDTKSMGIADVLDRAADLIEPEGAWTKGPFAVDKCGREVFEHLRGYPKEAVAFCAAGAITQASRGRNWRRREAKDLADSLTPVGSIIQFNEDRGRTQSEVVAKLREAAAKAREQGK